MTGTYLALGILVGDLSGQFVEEVVQPEDVGLGVEGGPAGLADFASHHPVNDKVLEYRSLPMR